jgi:hypothetical protein
MGSGELESEMEGRMRRCGELSTGGRLRRLKRNAAGGERAAASTEGEDALDLGREEGDKLVP